MRFGLLKSRPLTYQNLASPIANRRLDQDRASITPGGESDYWSAQQGQNKVLIRYQGQSLSKAPSKVQDWLADNLGPYGLFMPDGSTAAGETSPEDRIADGFDRVLVASLDSPSSRALGPSA
ncbi:MAG TPA: hypothetical protein DCS30_20540, partial [Rhizobiales bacterium]|nr:hypothetical protein [Hyphomicrobiales bacterium]